jgi:5-methylcytosine-specific restriction endonuclease McrA
MHQTFPKPPPRKPKRRKALARRSEKAQDFADELNEITPDLLARAHGICEICRTGPCEHRHHKLRRGQGGKNDLANLLFLCHGCHDRVHKYPSVSYAEGWLLKRSTSGLAYGDPMGYGC